MLTNDLVVTDNGTGTKPGALGAKTYSLLSVAEAKSVRRIAATALSTPQTMTISHELKGKNWAARARSLVRADIQNIGVDLASVGNIVPSAAVYLVIDRPVNTGGTLTATDVKNLVGAVLDVIMASGQLDKLLNMEP